MSFPEIAELVYHLAAPASLLAAAYFFVREQRRARRNEEVAIYQGLLDRYADFVARVADNADLGLLSSSPAESPLTPEQKERRRALFDLLITLFERAFVLVREGDGRARERYWPPWEAFVRRWCRREDFRAALPELLDGTDAEFQTFMRSMAQKSASAAGAA